MQEITHFSSSVLRLNSSLHDLFVRCMEETDNAVLYDHYSKAQANSEQAAAAVKKPRTRRT
jgi:hypothetical protein